MRGQKPDKYEVQKANTPLIPTSWDAAEALKYAKNVVLCFHGYLEQGQGQMLSDKGFISAWADKISNFRGSPWPNNVTVMSTLKAAAAENWDFRETFYTFCRLTYVESEPTVLIEAYRRMTLTVKQYGPSCLHY